MRDEFLSTSILLHFFYVWQIVYGLLVHLEINCYLTGMINCFFYFTFIKTTPIKRLETPEMILQRGQNLRSMLVILHTRVG